MAEEKRRKKGAENFVICHPVSSSSGLRTAPLHFGRRRFFGVPFLCVFPQRCLVNVANFRRGSGRVSLSFLLRPNPFVANFRELVEGEDSTRESNVKYFGNVNRWKVHPFPFRGARSCHFLFSFSASRKFHGLNRERLDPAATKKMRAKLTLRNE